MINKINKNGVRAKRHLRIRSHLKGTSEMPRLCVYRSTSHIYAQIIDDVKGVTITSGSTIAKGIDVKGMTKTQAAKAVGEFIAKRALDAGKGGRQRRSVLLQIGREQIDKPRGEGLQVQDKSKRVVLRQLGRCGRVRYSARQFV